MTIRRSSKNRQTTQPRWKLLQSTDSRALFVDETGQYPAELMTAQEMDDGRFLVHRFPIPRLKLVRGDARSYLVDENWDESYPHPLPQYEEWFASPSDIKSVSSSSGVPSKEIIAALQSSDPIKRSWAYEDMGNYFGFDNFDSYPETWSSKKMDKDWP